MYEDEDDELMALLNDNQFSIITRQECFSRLKNLNWDETTLEWMNDMFGYVEDLSEIKRYKDYDSFTWCDMYVEIFKDHINSNDYALGNVEVYYLEGDTTRTQVVKAEYGQ